MKRRFIRRKFPNRFQTTILLKYGYDPNGWMTLWEDEDTIRYVNVETEERIRLEK